MRRFIPAIFLCLLSSVSTTQTVSTLNLKDYVGTYTDSPGHTLEIVDGDSLFAVVDDAKYPLHPSGGDKFNTITG